MKLTAKGFAIFLMVLTLPALSIAQTDPFGDVDTIYADLAKIDDFNWSVTINYFNDEDVEGLSIPLKMSAGQNRIIADSAIYTGGRVENFDFTGFRPDTATQCVMLGIMANLGAVTKYLPPGNGRLVTIFVSSAETKPIENLVIDTTTLMPSNSLLVVANRSQHQGDKVDSITDISSLNIIPAFKVKYPE